MASSPRWTKSAGRRASIQGGCSSDSSRIDCPASRRKFVTSPSGDGRNLASAWQPLCELAMDQHTPAPLHCPSCSEHMQTLELPRRAVGSLQIDLCYACCLIWFDQSESTQLAPAAVLELFQQIH